MEDQGVGFESLRKIWVFPNMIGMQCIDNVSTVEDGSHPAWCLFDFVRAVRGKPLCKPHKTAVACQQVIGLDGDKVTNSLLFAILW